MMCVAVWLHTMFENYGCNRLQRLVMFPSYPLEKNELIYLYHDLQKLVITRDKNLLRYDKHCMSEYVLAVVTCIDKNHYKINFTYNI